MVTARPNTRKQARSEKTRQKRPEGQGVNQPQNERQHKEDFILSQLNNLTYTAKAAQHGLDVKINSPHVGGLEAQVRFFSGDRPSLSISYHDPTKSVKHVVYQSPDFLESVFDDETRFAASKVKEWLFREFLQDTVHMVKQKLTGLESKVKVQGSRVTLQLKSQNYGRADIAFKQIGSEYKLQRVDYYSLKGKKKNVYSYN